MSGLGIFPTSVVGPERLLRPPIDRSRKTCETFDWLGGSGKNLGTIFIR